MHEAYLLDITVWETRLYMKRYVSKYIKKNYAELNLMVGGNLEIGFPSDARP